MRNQLNKLNGKSFRYCGNVYEVIETKVVNYKAVIKTNRQTFVKTESEFSGFMEDIEFVKKEKKEAVKNENVPADTWLPSDVLVAKSSPLQAEIVVAESNATKVSNKLMEVFDLLAHDPTEETYKKAAAMVNVSNSIVNVQMAQIKFLTLKK
ncbi:hypothetical protein D3C85_601370 [compost metagenome]